MYKNKQTSTVQNIKIRTGIPDGTKAPEDQPRKRESQTGENQATANTERDENTAHAPEPTITTPPQGPSGPLPLAPAGPLLRGPGEFSRDQKLGHARLRIDRDRLPHGGEHARTFGRVSRGQSAKERCRLRGRAPQRFEDERHHASVERGEEAYHRRHENREKRYHDGTSKHKAGDDCDHDMAEKRDEKRHESARKVEDSRHKRRERTEERRKDSVRRRLMFE